MDVFLMVLTSIVCGIIATLTAKREGIGWWIGDQIFSLFGAGVGMYVVNTQNMHRALEQYLFWVVAVSAASAFTMLMFSNWLLGGEVEEDEAETRTAELAKIYYLDDHSTDLLQDGDYPNRRAA